MAGYGFAILLKTLNEFPPFYFRFNKTTDGLKVIKAN